MEYQKTQLTQMYKVHAHHVHIHEYDDQTMQRKTVINSTHSVTTVTNTNTFDTSAIILFNHNHNIFVSRDGVRKYDPKIPSLMYAELSNILILDMIENAIFFLRDRAEKGTSSNGNKTPLYIKMHLFFNMIYNLIHIANLPIEADQVSQEFIFLQTRNRRPLGAHQETQGALVIGHCRLTHVVLIDAPGDPTCKACNNNKCKNVYQSAHLYVENIERHDWICLNELTLYPQNDEVFLILKCSYMPHVIQPV